MLRQFEEEMVGEVVRRLGWRRRIRSFCIIGRGNDESAHEEGAV